MEQHFVRARRKVWTWERSCQTLHLIATTQHFRVFVEGFLGRCELWGLCPVFLEADVHPAPLRNVCGKVSAYRKCRSYHKRAVCWVCTCLAIHPPGWRCYTSVPIRNPGKLEMQVTPRYLSRNVQENLGKLAFPILLLLPDGDIKLPVKAGGLLSVTHSHFSLVSSSDLFELWSVRFNFTSKLFITLNTADICINILPKFSLSRDNQ